MMRISRLERIGRTLAISGLLVAVLSGSGQGTAHADESSEPNPGIYIEDAVATPAAAGETSIIGFRIDNFSGRSVNLMGVSSENATSALILIRGHGARTHIASGVSVMQEETLDLRTSHMWVELRGLKSAVMEGDLVPFELIFARGQVSAQAHAHAGAMPGMR